MKRHLFLALLLCFAAVPLFAARRTSNIVDDVSRMDVSADDMIALHDAGVSRAVIKAILDESAARGERRDSYRRDDGYDGYGYGYAPSVYLYGGYPYFYSPYYYDPF